MKYASLSFPLFADGIERAHIDWENDWAHPNCHPHLFLYKRGSISENFQTLPKIDGKKVFQHGVYVLIADHSTQGKFNVSIGASDGKKITEGLFDRLKGKTENPYPTQIMKDWHTAIVVCDWKDDIPILSSEKQTKKEPNLIDDKKVNTFREEIELIEKIIQEILENKKIFNIQVRGTKYKSAIANPASNRYNYYIYSVLNILAEKFPSAIKCNSENLAGNATKLLPMLMLNGEFCLGEKLYCDYNSEAIVCDFEGRVLLENYDNSQSSPQITSI